MKIKKKGAGMAHLRKVWTTKVQTWKHFSYSLRVLDLALENKNINKIIFVKRFIFRIEINILKVF